jgi:hypothetical protein
MCVRDGWYHGCCIIRLYTSWTGYIRSSWRTEDGTRAWNCMLFSIFPSLHTNSLCFSVLVCTLTSCIIFSQHGEPGAAVVDVEPVDVVVSHVLQQILSPVCTYMCYLYGSVLFPQSYRSNYFSISAGDQLCSNYSW